MLEEYLSRINRGLALIDEHTTIAKAFGVLRELCLINVQTGAKCVEIAEQLSLRDCAIAEELKANTRRMDELRKQIEKEYGIEEG